MKQLAFALDDEGNWPPVLVEHLWCVEIDGLFEVRSTPFFVKGLAVGDRFSAEPDPVNGCIFEFSARVNGGHSLVRIMDSGDVDSSLYRREIQALGCSLTTWDEYGLSAFDVPVDIDIQAINDLVDKIQDAGVPISFPVWRHAPDE
ncbi:MAG: hypothetical protein RL095_3255 [Verrucomicrobiota bacterium]